MDELDDLPAEAFAKYDRTPDALFYSVPRFVTHIDDRALAAVTDLYRHRLSSGGVVLDLMSSWVSHLPPEMAFASVIGLGMNAEELAANRRLTKALVRDLNAQPDVPLATGSVDAVVICASVQYLQHPVRVLADARRVLRPGGITVITFSNRCFPTKAVAIWGALGGDGRKRLVRLYLERAGFAAVEDCDPVPDDGTGDPLHAVIARNADP